ncbi:MAG: hypothetical protein J6R47_02785 [Acholeplasmatales bacterium]|nr:hypothetical protein [Acholeplasmatales bacterium]
MTEERIHYEIIFYSGKEMQSIQEHWFEDVENWVWHLKQISKFVKVFEVKEIFENGIRVDVEIKEEEV